ncbi:MAG: hypothetical protein OJJ21_17350 [Ferrovibrio sp.]|uniref:hypothetical protein n=1 Tax=Ferrovibrio sp. TaxID=1917215 RepID=UPI0026331154|nr:hypothetical protein [Ferrovibrio sp.]MCW0235369.1 hypothetical protein [Ferrovibrio sp.]
MLRKMLFQGLVAAAIIAGAAAAYAAVADSAPSQHANASQQAAPDNGYIQPDRSSTSREKAERHDKHRGDRMEKHHRGDRKPHHDAEHDD